jgi:hypothetical protein
MKKASGPFPSNFQLSVFASRTWIVGPWRWWVGMVRGSLTSPKHSSAARAPFGNADRADFPLAFTQTPVTAGAAD